MSAVLPIVSGVFSAIGSIQEGNAKAAADQQDAAIAAGNKLIADQDRRVALQTSAAAVDDQVRANRRTSASIKAAFGNSGFEMSGSALDVLSDNAREDAISVNRLQQEGRGQNRKYALEMLGYDMSKQQDLAAANDAQTAGMLGAVGAILNTGAQLQSQATTALTRTG